ncbi:MAG: glycosyltransferase family 4 protein [Desulfobacterales bacterium]|nr:glycosyltransferase family 4 protein [Desulfobacterales bacterium]MDP6806687.1 glycosyltransferase family 4 protein [Desulfobacterales bacterium]
MKIAHIIPYYHGVGGLQVCVHNISERHAKTGHSVHVFSWEKNNRISGERYFNESFHHFRWVKLTYPLCKLWLYRYVKNLQEKFRFDLWQMNGGFPYGAVLADFFINKNMPCVLRCSGDDIQIDHELDYGIRRNKKADRMIRDNYHKYNAVIAITDTIRKEYSALGISTEKIKLIPNGVDYERIHTFSPTLDIRKRHHIPQDGKIILTVGRYHPKKGYSLIPKILKRLLEAGLNVYWIVIGGGITRIDNTGLLDRDSFRMILLDEMRPDANENNLPSNELITYYKESDIFAMTSLMESFGIVLIEAMAAGLPIVCFDAPGVRDVMNSNCGTICSPKDIDEFFSALANHLGAEGRSRIAANCTKHAAKFSWDAIADRYLSLYASLV